MPGLNDQVAYINTTLQKSQFSSNKFAGSQWYNIADVVMTTGEVEGKSRKEPMIVSAFGSGSAISLSFDDRYPMMVYHQLDDLRYSLSPIDAGPAGTIRLETADMRILFWADRSKLNFRPEQLIAAVEASFPIQFAPTLAQSFGNASTTIEMGSVNDDPYDVFNKEWPGSDFDFFTTTLLFSISYRINNTFNAACFQLCP
jgi:hypothetical protein